MESEFKSREGLGKHEDDYPWKRRQEVLRLSPHVADLCYEDLRRERWPRSLDEVYERMTWAAYLAFSEEELLDFLRSEGRFLIIEGSEPSVALKAHLRSEPRSHLRS